MNEKKGFFDGNPKMLFIFGLVTGVAVTSLLGGSISLDGLKAKTGSNTDVVREFDAPTDDGSAPTGGELAAVTGDEHIRGDIENAKIVLVEYSDFECPFCGRHHPTMEQLLDEFGDDVAWVYRHFPLSFHPEAIPSALASECAAEQGKFWEFADIMFDNQDGLSEDFYTSTATDIGLDMDQYADCYESEKYADDITEDASSGQTAGVSGTPATYINGVSVSGAVPYETLAGIIEQMLAE